MFGWPMLVAIWQMWLQTDPCLAPPRTNVIAKHHSMPSNSSSHRLPWLILMNRNTWRPGIPIMTIYILIVHWPSDQTTTNADQPRFPTRSRWGQFASHCNSCSRCWPACTPGRTQQRFHPQMDDEKQKPKAAVWLDLNQQKKGFDLIYARKPNTQPQVCKDQPWDPIPCIAFQPFFTLMH